MDIKEFKRELSKVTGIDFFNPKYRSIFKKFAGEDEPSEADGVDEKSADVAETVATDEPKTEAIAESVPKDESDNEPDNKETEADGPAAEAEGKEQKPSEKESAVEEPAEEGDDGDGEGESQSASGDSQAEAEPEVATEEEATQPAADMGDELLTTKLELELVRAGVREDRLDTAKRLFMPEFQASGGNTQQIRELIAQYPEWIGKQGGGAQGFGMPLGDKADAFTNEEKALKRMGIDPRN